MSLYDKLSSMSREQLMLMILQMDEHKNIAQVDEPIAVIGMSFRFPGDYDTKESFWEMLKNGVNACTDFPESRFGEYGFTNEVPKKAGLLSDLKRFDADFFQMPGRLARNANPEQRISLECTYDAFLDAGYNMEQIRGTKTSVVLGVGSFGEYFGLRHKIDTETVDFYSLCGGTNSVTVGAISYSYDLRGPCFSVDTACSSSIVAIHQSCNLLHSGLADIALTGGVDMIVSPIGLTMRLRAGMLSPTNELRAFDSRGNGYVRGEGCGMIVLKRLSDAIRDKDKIYCLIRGTALNTNGKTNSITVPRADAQVDVMRAALNRAGVNPKDVSFMEAHGTGTSVGDPIEAKAIIEAFCGDRGNDLLVGTVKSNVGHLEAASGVVSLVKVALCMKHKQIPPQANFEQLHPEIEKIKKKFHVVHSLTPWHPEGPRIAAINSTGISGINGHVIVEEYDESKYLTKTTTGKNYTLALAAKTEKSLLASVNEVQKRLSNCNDEEAEIFCLEMTRLADNFSKRAFFSGVSKSEILQRLKEYVAQPQPAGATSTDQLMISTKSLLRSAEDFNDLAKIVKPFECSKANVTKALLDKKSNFDQSALFLALALGVEELLSKLGVVVTFQNEFLDVAIQSVKVNKENIFETNQRLQSAKVWEQQIDADTDELLIFNFQTMNKIFRSQFLAGKKINWDSVLRRNNSIDSMPLYQYDRREFWFKTK